MSSPPALQSPRSSFEISNAADAIAKINGPSRETFVAERKGQPIIEGPGQEISATARAARSMMDTPIQAQGTSGATPAERRELEVLVWFLIPLNI